MAPRTVSPLNVYVSDSPHKTSFTAVFGDYGAIYNDGVTIMTLRCLSLSSGILQHSPYTVKHLRMLQYAMLQ
jgi:hypothetical protein